MILKKFFQSHHNMMVAHARAVKLFKGWLKRRTKNGLLLPLREVTVWHDP